MTRLKIIQIQQRECQRCLYVWYPRTEREPKQCPKCKSAYWDRPKQEARPEGLKQA